MVEKMMSEKINVQTLTKNGATKKIHDFAGENTMSHDLWVVNVT